MQKIIDDITSYFQNYELEDHMYGIMLSIGVIILALFYLRRMAKLGATEKELDLFTYHGLASGAVAYIGAAFFQSIWSWLARGAQVGQPFSFSWTGITFEGGVLSAMIFFLLTFPFFFKKYYKHGLYYMDQVVMGILIAHVFGRIGCWYAGCCYGKHATVEWMEWLTVPYLRNGIDRGNIYPTQLIEAIYLLISFIVFVLCFKKNQSERYVISYGVYRFFAEYLRGDFRGNSPFGDLTPSQFMSIIWVLFGVVLIIFRKLQRNKEIKEYNNLKDKSSFEKPTLYYHESFKGLFKGIFKPCKCEKCNKNMKLKFKSVVSDFDIVSKKIDAHLIYQCKCGEEKEIK